MWSYVPWWKDGKKMSTNKYDKMITVNREVSRDKIVKAQNAIMSMTYGKEKICVTELMKRTSLSRGFFYKNPEVRKTLEEGLKLQKSTIVPNPRKSMLELATTTRMKKMQKQIDKLTFEKEELEEENKRLQIALEQKTYHVYQDL